MDELLAQVQNRWGANKCTFELGQITLEVNCNELIDVCVTLRDCSEFQFAQLIDLCAVDYLTYGIDEWSTTSATKQGFSRAVTPFHKRAQGNEPINGMPARFAVVYHLLSVTLNQRIRLKVFLTGEQLKISSVLNVWQSADWYEREAFDLYGIIFEGHPDLRRILTDYGFIGHPFRKDFPLIGHVEMRYDAAEARVIYEPVSIEPRTLVPKVIRYVGSTAEDKI